MSDHDFCVKGQTTPNGISHSGNDHEPQCQPKDELSHTKPTNLVNKKLLNVHGVDKARVEDVNPLGSTTNGTVGRLNCPSDSPINRNYSEIANVNRQSPIAICGMALRLPGGISTSRELWDFLLAKKDARSRVPQSRYNVSAFYDPTGKPGTVTSEYGYFLEDDISRLDASFFNMARIEVERLDPQQRLMLEATRECFEDAGVTNWRGGSIGCYMGNFGEDWCEMFARESQNWGNYRISGYGDFTLSNRISYEMDLQGPRFAVSNFEHLHSANISSVTIRTACSASLVALHEACIAVSRGDCEAAVVGGANLIMTPGTTASMTEQGVLSSDGSCKTFSADADGYARGEAITALYIKTLDDAVRDGNPVRGIIRATAINHDGKTPGMTVPSSNAQETLIRKAYQIAGIADVSQTAYVECHGTGTPIGDPIEVAAVGRVFGKHGVYIGSVKPNVGHTEGASGLVSVIKTILALENRIIPPNIKFTCPNPAINFDSAKLTVPTEAIAWPIDRLERASVNSFGVGGTNAHVILDAAASFRTSDTRRQVISEPQLLLFSANSSKALAEMVHNYREFLERHPDRLEDLAYTLANKREHLPCRTFAIGTDGSFHTTYPATKSVQPSSVVMIFTGQGAQWPQMGRELLDANSTFLDRIQTLDRYLQAAFGPNLTWKIEEQLHSTGRKTHFNSAKFSQPLCAAIQIALVDTFASLGIKPRAVVGHSSGEIAAAYAAGALTAEEAILIAMHRGNITGAQKRSGAMAAIGLGWEQTKKYLLPNVNVACDNSPDSVTISGDPDSVEDVITSVKKKQSGVLARKLQVDTAYHSFHMAEIGSQYESLIEKFLILKKPTKPFVSTVTGSLVQSASLDPGYWRRNLESPVLFRTAISCLQQHGLTENAVFMEIGPHSALAGPLRQNMSQLSSTAHYVPAMMRNEDCALTLLAAIGKLFSFRVPFDLQALMPLGSCLSDLPRYPWDHEEKYWYESRLSRDYRQRKYPHHDLLGLRVAETSDLEPSWRNLLHLDSAAWIRDHKVINDIVFPFTGYVAMAGEAARQVSGINESFRLRHVLVSTALVVTEGMPTEIITTLHRQRLTDTLDSQWWEFSISSYNGITWTKHCTGAVLAQSETPRLSRRHVQPLASPRKVSVRRWIHTLRRAGLDLGPAFCNLEDISANTTTQTAVAKVLNDRHSEHNRYHLHPTVLDNAVQMVSVAFVRGQARNYQNRLPVSCDHIEITRTISSLTVEATTKSIGESALGEMHGFADGVNVLSMTGLRLAIAENSYSLGARDTHAAARLVWGPDVDFVDLREMAKPSTDLSSYTPILEELCQLCLIHTQRCKNSSLINKTYLRRFDTWIETRYESLDSPCNLDTETIWNRIRSLSTDLANTPAGSAAMALRSVCENINAIYSGHISSWETLLTNEAVAGAYDFIDQYDALPFVQRLCHCKPNLRVLEIGSSRRQPSRRVLDSLKLPGGRLLCSKYKFTSKGFDVPLQNQIESAMVEYTTLDIQEDLGTQGFDDDQYDLILANNTVHSDRSISTSLRNIRRLLSPGGYLLLQELCPGSKWLNFIFGTQSTWWCGLNDGRLEEPLIDRQRWQQELSAAGFACSNDGLLDSDERFHLNNIFIVKAATMDPPSRCVSLLCGDQDMDVGPISQHLEAQGFQVLKCTLNDWPQPRRDVIALLDKDKPFFEKLDAHTFNSFKTFLQRLDNSGILWITKPSQLHCQDPRYAQVLGTARTIRSELLIDFATCEVDDVDKATAQIIQVLVKFRERATIDSLRADFEYSIHEGVIHVGRYYPFALCDELLVSDPCSGAKLDIEIPGRLGTLYWIRQPELPPLQPEEVEIEMCSVSLNFRDVLVAMRIVELPERVLGLEGAGIVRRVGSRVNALHVGDRVATVERGVFSTLIRTLEILCVKLPDRLNLDEAATMFLPFLTAMHSLVTVGGLKKGQSVLIHSACGGVGIAAVQIAHMVGAEVYITVGTDEKVEYAVKTLNIPRHRIFSSRDESFTDGIMRETQGQGVDLVLNSLSGELLHATWRCVSPFGKVVEIGKRDLIGFGKLDMNPFLANRSYCCVDVDAFHERPAVIHKMLESILELFEAGKITPIPTRLFSATSTCDAFRFMQRGQHIGRICVSLYDTPGVSNLEGKIRGQPKYPKLHESASYLLVGGLGGLGRAISVWMVEQGARHLVFLSPNAGNNPEHGGFIKELDSMGCHAQIYTGSVTNLEDVVRAVSEATRPLKGILQMSMVLRDANFFEMSIDQWDAAVSPKIQGTWNLHNATVSAGLDLDFFVLFSSLSGVVGLPGQANYASANTFLDAFVQYRVSLGLAACAIDIGAVGEIGYIFEHQDLMQKTAASGFKTLNEQEVLDALALALISKTPFRNSFESSGTHIASDNVYILGLASAMPLKKAANRAIWKNDRRMAVYHNASGDDSDSSISNESLKSFIASAKADISVLQTPDAGSILGAEIGKRLCNLLMKPEEDLDTTLSLSDLGIDSLVGIELRAWWKQALGFDISVLEMLGKGTLGALGQHAANELAKIIQAEQGGVATVST